MLALLSILTTGCSQTVSTATTGKPVCVIWQGISYSAKSDSPETVLAIRQNNAKRESYCK